MRQPSGEVVRERQLARASDLAQLVDRAGAVDDGGDERAERRERQRRGQLMADVSRLVRDRALREHPIHERERIGAAAEVGRPALEHARGVERIRDGDGSRPGRREMVGEPVDDGVPPLAELLGVARGLQSRLRTNSCHPSAFSPVRSRPTMSVWMSCVPS